MLTVQRSTAQGAPDFRIFNIAGGRVDVTLSNLTIANGRVQGTAASGNSANIGGDSFGGGIYSASSGTVNVMNSTLTGIVTVGGVASGSENYGGDSYGGGIYHAGSGTMNVMNSTLTGNTATGSTASGGSINNIVGNGLGGGIYNVNSGRVNLANSTLTGNSAATSGGGGFNDGLFSTRNTILAGNTGSQGPEVIGSLTSQGYNLIGNNTDATITSATGDQIGTSGSPLDPLLAPLGNYGGQPGRTPCCPAVQPLTQAVTRWPWMPTINR